ncbi:unnamed protein product [Heligmosomoides polygyrus]|uniref:Rab proteins geranylgeranyltransferase component A n=1 Tax=Heligmosomoides polygyrus TaxID=6339 RepID=A0A3P7XTD1_HELPZ|nr:unnamed protein product [Heligmosomoides polygyrus]
MSESLPDTVDVVVLGTGLTESIIAAACSRSGFSVLHLDRNKFYGGDWASFNLTTIGDWVEQQKKAPDGEVDVSKYSDKLTEGESLMALGARKTVRNVHQEWLPGSEAMMTVDKGDNAEQKTIREVVESEWRRFSIDLVPKVLLARGSMVQTLCDSEVAKYAEFKCVDRFLCIRDDSEEKLAYSRVPCSKGDIFQDETLEMVDKRRLMKFMTFCLEWNTKADELEGWKEYQDEPFEKFLESQEITGELRSYIADAIGILHPNATTKEGLTAVCRFVDSVGRFGPSPFLTSLYGSGEIPQCFCRLCAVFGGLYCLGRPVEALIHKDGKVVGIIADGHRVNCTHLIMSSEYVPAEVKSQGEEKWIDRAVYITNKSIWTEEKEHVLTTASLELPMDNAVCVSGADHALDYATSIDEAQRVFSTFWPDRDFLPRSLPKPEEEDEGVVEGEPVEQVA